MRWQDEPWFAVVVGALAGVLFFALYFVVSDEGWAYSLLVGVLWFFGMWFMERRRWMKRRSAQQH